MNSISYNDREPGGQDLQDQLNSSASTVATQQSGRLPSGVNPGSVTGRRVLNGAVLHFADGSKQFTSGVVVPNAVGMMLPMTMSTTAPTATQFPLPGNFGFHFNTATSALYLAFNYGGVVKSVVLS